MKPVLTKQDFVRRYAQGEFGNRSPTWESVEEFLPYGDPSKLYHLRNRVAGGPTYYNLSPLELKRLYYAGCYEGDWYVSEMAPTEDTIIQGEVRRSTSYLDFYCSTVVAPMREALERGGQSLHGMKAVGNLKAYMDHNSYDWLWYLLDTYEDHVIELSVYNRFWGTVPRRNTVIWEVRKY